MVEMVMCAAVLHHGVIYQGRRHCDAIRLAVISSKRQPVDNHQGFWTSANRYVGRKEALQLAIEARQLSKVRKSQFGLFSEDLY